jgi:heme/copper-type cytochrome/quinol oxidase subunit 3
MSVQALRTLRPVGTPRRPPPVLANGVLGMLIFVLTEVMFFAGLISAFTIVRASSLVWPPPGQPRLPLEATLFNTGVLLASGVMLFVARRRFRRDHKLAERPLLVAMLLGAFFVVFQGHEWVGLIREGLTLTSSTLGSFFYLIVGLHALHAVVALGVLAWAWHRSYRGWPQPNALAAAEVFWYFVVGMWPLLYWRVYL